MGTEPDHLVEAFGVIAMPGHIGAEPAVLQFEGELLRRAVGQPDDEAGENRRRTQTGSCSFLTKIS